MRLRGPGGRGHNRAPIAFPSPGFSGRFSAAGAASRLAPAAARAQSCMTLRYSFQPDCYRPDASSACVQSVTHMDLGPQIAVWLQDRRGAFVDTLMVTNATSVRGIGNRPGRSDFLSGPLFPYGKRIMALPIWAHARGKTYSTLFMQEEVCAVGGPTRELPRLARVVFVARSSTTAARSSRPRRRRPSAPRSTTRSPARASSTARRAGSIPTMPSYYPPRSDLTTFTSIDGSDPPTFAAVNDLDAVAAATPPTARSTTGPGRSPARCRRAITR